MLFIFLGDEKMKPWDYFNWLKTLNYIHAGFNADYDVQRINNDVYVSFKETTIVSNLVRNFVSEKSHISIMLR